jgi:hypothetical protein
MSDARIVDVDHALHEMTNMKVVTLRWTERD